MFFMARQPPVGQGLLIVEISRSHSVTPQSIGLLWTSDQLVAETSDNIQHSQETNIHAPLPDSNLQFPQAIGRRPTP